MLLEVAKNYEEPPIITPPETGKDDELFSICWFWLIIIIVLAYTLFAYDKTAFPVLKELLTIILPTLLLLIANLSTCTKLFLLIDCTFLLIDALFLSYMNTSSGTCTICL